MGNLCRRIRLAAGATLGVLLMGTGGVLTGCGGQGSAGTDREPALGRVQVLRSSLNLHLPMERYIATDQEVRRVDRARLVLIDRCMGRFGLRYVVQQPSGEYGPRTRNERRYGITDEALAARDGYGLGARDPSRQPPPRKPRLGPDGQSALFGRGQSTVRGRVVPEGGCVGEANRTLNRTDPAGADANLGARLSFEIYERSERDSRVKRVLQAWSRCMAERGMRYADPLVPPGDPALQADKTAAIKVALADIQCKQATNVVGVWFAVESAYQQRAIDQNASRLKLTRQALDGELEIAQSVLREVAPAS